MAHKNKNNTSPYKTRIEKRHKDKSVDVLRSQTLAGKHKKPDTIYELEEANDRLRDFFSNHDFGHIGHETRLQLAQFYRLLMVQQGKDNFTRLLSFKDIAIKHFIDCLIVDQMTKLTFPLMDMGTGPGFPGIPLKFLHPDQQIILAEGVQKRVEFLKSVRTEMNLKKLDIIGRNINPYFAYPVNGVITRAVEDISNTLGNVLTCLKLGGKVFLMKGPGVDPEIQPALDKFGEWFQLEKDHTYTLPKSENHRRLLVFKKIKPAPTIDFDEEPWPED